MVHNPEALFDVLTILGELSDSLGGMSRLETQRSSYLACLLALYDRVPIADWGYRFARTGFGTPYSADVNEGIDNLLAGGFARDDRSRLTLTGSGENLRDTLATLRSNMARAKYVMAACGSTLMVPAAIFSEGLESEPTVQRAFQRDRGGALLEGPALSLLYEQFEALALVAGPSEGELLSPSVIWLSYLAGTSVSKRGGA